MPQHVVRIRGSPSGHVIIHSTPEKVGIEFSLSMSSKKEVRFSSTTFKFFLHFYVAFEVKVSRSDILF